MGKNQKFKNKVASINFQKLKTGLGIPFSSSER